GAGQSQPSGQMRVEAQSAQLRLLDQGGAAGPGDDEWAEWLVRICRFALPATNYGVLQLQHAAIDQCCACLGGQVQRLPLDEQGGVGADQQWKAEQVAVLVRPQDL